MKYPKICKICDRCGEKFDIPNIKESVARSMLIEFFPCPHCGFVKDIIYKKNNRSGRCRGCSIPFTLVTHHAKGRCERCYMRLIRNKNTYF